MTNTVHDLSLLISQRLKLVRETKGWTVDQLAAAIDMSVQSVRKFERPSSDLIPTDALLALILNDEWGHDDVRHILGLNDIIESKGGHRYKISLPDRLQELEGVSNARRSRDVRAPMSQLDEFNRGIEVFKMLFNQGCSYSSLMSQLNISFDSMGELLRSVFVNHVVQFTKVQQDEALAKQVKTKFGLKRVLVADVRTPDDCELPYFEAMSPLRAEMVSSLASHEVFSKLWQPKYVLLGGGYTIMRMINNSAASAEQFVGTMWIPAISFPRQRGDTSDFAVTPHYSADYLAAYLASRYARSEAVWLPYKMPGVEEHVWDQQAKAEVMDTAERATCAFLSVMGMERRDGSGVRHKGDEGFGADRRQYGKFHVLLDALEQRGYWEPIAGEIVGHFLDDSGKPIEFPPDLATDVERLSTHIELSTLRQIEKHNEIWLVAACIHKARAVRMAIRAKLVNALVIDSEIAQWLLDN